MTCNFRNSSGTDLDNIFYVNNSYAGTIGYKCSNGQDLGNRYPSGSLGYSIGYKNSSGTDIGYLRCKLTAPSATCSLRLDTHSTYKSTDSYYGEGSGSVYCSFYGHRLKFIASYNVTNGQNVSSVQYSYELMSTHPNMMKYLISSSEMPPDLSTYAGNYSCYINSVGGEWGDGKNLPTDTYTSVLSNSTGIAYINGLRDGFRDFYVKARVKCTLSNSVGSTTIYSNEIEIQR